jgi:hypothetical protein
MILTNIIVFTNIIICYENVDLIYHPVLNDACGSSESYVIMYSNVTESGLKKSI